MTCALCPREQETVLIGDSRIPVGQSCYEKLIDAKAKWKSKVTKADLQTMLRAQRIHK